MSPEPCRYLSSDVRWLAVVRTRGLILVKRERLFAPNRPRRCDRQGPRADPHLFSEGRHLDSTPSWRVRTSTTFPCSSTTNSASHSTARAKKRVRDPASTSNDPTPGSSIVSRWPSRRNVKDSSRLSRLVYLPKSAS